MTNSEYFGIIDLYAGWAARPGGERNEIMSVFLIDYENLHTSAFSGLEELTEEDRVLVFYTNNSDSLTFSLMQRLNAAKASIEYLRVSCGGKNSLDFQLCSYLGYLMGVHRDTGFCIVSRDKGFTVVLNFWEERAANGNTVFFSPSIRSCLNRSAALSAGETAAEALQDTETEAEQSQTEQSQAEQVQTEQSAPEEAAEAVEEPALEQAEPQPEQSQAEQSQTESEQPEQPAEKPKRKYNRRAPYKRKTKTPTDQSA